MFCLKLCNGAGIIHMSYSVITTWDTSAIFQHIQPYSNLQFCLLFETHTTLVIVRKSYKHLYYNHINKIHDITELYLKFYFIINLLLWK